MAAEAIVTAHLGAAGYTTRLSDGKHEWIADEPETLGGADLGPAPTALLLSTVMMLRWLEQPAEADRLEKAILGVYTEGTVRTADLGGMATTDDFTQAIIDAL